jgi:hypothetical protein
LIPLRVIEAPPDPENYGPSRYPPDGVEVGDMWRVPKLDKPERECWAIVLPNKAGVWFTTETAGGSGMLWEVSGKPPAITVHPSINAEPQWHGWIKNGIME